MFCRNQRQKSKDPRVLGNQYWGHFFGGHVTDSFIDGAKKNSPRGSNRIRLTGLDGYISSNSKWYSIYPRKLNPPPTRP